MPPVSCPMSSHRHLFWPTGRRKLCPTSRYIGSPHVLGWGWSLPSGAPDSWEPWNLTQVTTHTHTQDLKKYTKLRVHPSIHIRAYSHCNCQPCLRNKKGKKETNLHSHYSQRHFLKLTGAGDASIFTVATVVSSKRQVVTVTEFWLRTSTADIVQHNGTLRRTKMSSEERKLHTKF